MKEKQISSLKDMYDHFLEESEKIEKELQGNLNRISEIDQYLDSVYAHEDADFKVFSPRNVDSIYKEEINSQKAKKYELENSNRELYGNLNRLHIYLDLLKQSMEGSASSVSSSRNLQVLDVQEKERQRIARDLHDTSLQNLTHLIHKVELANMYAEKDLNRTRLELMSVNKGLKAVIEEMRNIVFDLRPMQFDDLGLKETFERMFQKLKETNPSFDFETKIDVISCKNNLILMTIFRVVQEACANAIGHSGGNKILVKVEQNQSDCYILVQDNGLGFKPEDVTGEEKHFGILIMEERVHLLGGRMQITSSPEKGTAVEIEIPLENEDTESERIDRKS